MNSLWWLVIVFAALAAMLFALSLREHKRSGLPQAEVVFADTNLWQSLPRPLVDERLGLIGKPDYVVRTPQGSVIPIEVKTGRTPANPYQSHRLQLMAYGMLIANTYHQTPKYGLLHYPERDFEVRFSSELEAELLDTLKRMRWLEQGRSAPARSHNIPARCRNCGYSSICDQKLT